MEAAGKLAMDEYNFFLRGGVVLDREGQMDNPCQAWLPEPQWDNITELDKLTNFHGIMASFEMSPRDWKSWYISPTPETGELPGEWDSQLGCKNFENFSEVCFSIKIAIYKNLEFKKSTFYKNCNCTKYFSSQHNEKI